jgi:predicted DNA-binding protein (MmcQ/YjbR family)
MTTQELSNFALRLPDAYEDHPFGETPDIYRISGRIFAFVMQRNEQPEIAVKCEPNLAGLLRAQYSAVTPGYHLNKRHWNTVLVNSDVPDDEILEMIVHSYEQVLSKLPKASKSELRHRLVKFLERFDAEMC